MPRDDIIPSRNDGRRVPARNQTELAVASGRKWPTGLLAFWGALFGATLVIAHVMYDLFFRVSYASDPFARIVIEFAAAAFGGALLFASVSAIHNRIARVEP
jgi:hypothetical protein